MQTLGPDAQILKELALNKSNQVSEHLAKAAKSFSRVGIIRGSM